MKNIDKKYLRAGIYAFTTLVILLVIHFAASSIFVTTIERAITLFTILLLSAIAGMLSERSGIVNIAIDGFMIIGALAFSIIGNKIYGGDSGNWNQIIAILLGILFATGFAALMALATINLRSDHVVVGVALNLLSMGIAAFTIKALDYPDKVEVLYEYMTLPGDGLIGSIKLTTVIALLIALSTWFIINKTRKGLRFRSCGENPHAAAAVGINVNKYRWIAVLLSGALAGLAGTLFVETTSNFYFGNVKGYGFIAIAILIFGKWRVPNIMIGALIYSVIGAFAEYGFNYPILQDINKDILQTLPFIISIGYLIIFSKSSRAPKAAGKHYAPEDR